MNKTFPMRYVTIVGIRPDNTFRARPFVKVSESKKIVSEFQSRKEFVNVAIIEKPSEDYRIGSD